MCTCADACAHVWVHVHMCGCVCTCVGACAYVWVHVHMWGAQADLVLEDTSFLVDGCGVLEPC